MSKKTVFNTDWINPQMNPKWANVFAKVEGDVFSVLCKICSKRVALSNMCKQALTSHEKCTSHTKRLKTVSTTTNLLTCLKNKNDAISTPTMKLPSQLQEIPHNLRNDNLIVSRNIMGTTHS
ncbi:unnamed protein product [Brassicogethes aeneus]|uniref:Uncharacterized protein n=1 Tax=Brassicogethes aeneus TaxID=1431903 RepID=A0A9P0BIT1_BRAAE|nr:unnamed protein product [Brassicogethes aeneus]